ncbi:MAG: outer membrane lipoprotein-sorting protein [Kangiellaceae bacterium]|nr:outer membrane lipoprotein-sorting protein [Kangiellaceae bacterium]
MNIWPLTITTICLFVTNVQGRDEILELEARKGKAEEIVKESELRDLGWGNSASSLTMRLKNSQGEESVRELKVKTLEIDNDGDKNLIIFERPADIKGTAFLSYSHATIPDQQWIYLPSIKRVKRISTTNKSGPFVGSEFAFEDISSFEIEKYSYQYQYDETINNIECFVIEYKPRYEYSGYKRLMVWIDKKEYRNQKTDFYDRKNSLLKTLVYSDY